MRYSFKFIVVDAKDVVVVESLLHGIKMSDVGFLGAPSVQKVTRDHLASQILAKLPDVVNAVVQELWEQEVPRKASAAPVDRSTWCLRFASVSGEQKQFNISVEGLYPLEKDLLPFAMHRCISMERVC